ncbi:hypothetical protein BKA81DRAFT_91462 [Phyllosticta paracitricarpa]
MSEITVSCDESFYIPVSVLITSVKHLPESRYAALLWSSVNISIHAHDKQARHLRPPLEPILPFPNTLTALPTTALSSFQVIPANSMSLSLRGHAFGRVASETGARALSCGLAAAEADDGSSRKLVGLGHGRGENLEQTGRRGRRRQLGERGEDDGVKYGDEMMMKLGE